MEKSNKKPERKLELGETTRELSNGARVRENNPRERLLTLPRAVGSNLFQIIRKINGCDFEFFPINQTQRGSDSFLL